MLYIKVSKDAKKASHRAGHVYKLHTWRRWLAGRLAQQYSKQRRAKELWVREGIKKLKKTTEMETQASLWNTSLHYVNKYHCVIGLTKTLTGQ